MLSKPTAQLLSMTPMPLQQMWNAWYWTRDRKRCLLNPYSTTIPSASFTSELVQHALMCISEHVPIPEGINMIWGVDRIPRALQEQMVRTRKAWFFCETMRVKDKSKFYQEGNFFDICEPLGCVGDVSYPKDAIRSVYHTAMRESEEHYRDLLQMGVPPEMARGVLPLHVGSSLVMGINLREFVRLVGNRTCEIAQGDYWRPLMADFRNELLPYLGEEICEYIFAAPCDRSKGKTCIMPQEAEDRRGGRSPYPSCYKYDKYFPANSGEGEKNSA